MVTITSDELIYRSLNITRNAPTHCSNVRQFCFRLFSVPALSPRVSPEVDFQEYLHPAKLVNSDHEIVADTCKKILGKAGDAFDVADPHIAHSVTKKLYEHARDNYRFDTLTFSEVGFQEEMYQASEILQRPAHFCMTKAIMMCALVRHCRIPSRVGFQRIRNSMFSPALWVLIGNNEVTNGVCEVFLDGRWRTVMPMYHPSMCERMNLDSVPYDSEVGACVPKFTRDGKKVFEILYSYGVYPDFPLQLFKDVLIETDMKNFVVDGRIPPPISAKKARDLIDQYLPSSLHASGANLNKFAAIVKPLIRKGLRVHIEEREKKKTRDMK
eukprot:Rmarinus@m.6936